MLKNKIKLIIIILPLALTSAVLIFNYNFPWFMSHYRTTTAIQNINALENAIDMFHLDTYKTPTTEEGLLVLLRKPKNHQIYFGPYVRKIKKDPWGNHYIYKDEKKHEVEFIIYSKGPDGLDDNGYYDDVVNWDKEYDCDLNYRCPTFADDVRLWIYAFTGISYIILLVYFAYLYSIKKIILFRNEINSK